MRLTALNRIALGVASLLLGRSVQEDFEADGIIDARSTTSFQDAVTIGSLLTE